jgi:hypothetical protein
MTIITPPELALLSSFVGGKPAALHQPKSLYSSTSLLAGLGILLGWALLEAMKR